MLKLLSLQDIYKFIDDDLKQVDALTKESLSYRDQSIDSIANYVISAGGKRLRPLFVVISAKLFGYQGKNHINIATAIEFIHTATLLHDDVIDESKMRRGKITANEKWSNKYSVLVGDFLFSQSFQLMVATGLLGVLELLSKASSIIAEGEIRQLNNIGNVDISQDEYIAIIKAKTAELFAAACKSGAIIAEQDKETQDKMHELGMNIGIAFQIIDDLLDYTSDAIGKDKANDFKEGKVTLPVIFTNLQATSAEKQFIARLFADREQGEGDLDKFMDLMQKYDAFNQSKAVALHFITSAENILNKIPKTPEYKDIFESILKYQVSRVS